MVVANGAYKYGKYDKIWLKSLRLMSKSLSSHCTRPTGKQMDKWTWMTTHSIYYSYGSASIQTHTSRPQRWAIVWMVERKAPQVKTLSHNSLWAIIKETAKLVANRQVCNMSNMHVTCFKSTSLLICLFPHLFMSFTCITLQSSHKYDLACASISFMNSTCWVAVWSSSQWVLLILHLTMST